MEFKRRMSMPKIMIIPMIDIIFFLLVFFMISMLSMVHQKSIPVHLPASSTAAVNVEKMVPITINKSGAVFIEKNPVPIDGITTALQSYKKEGTKLQIILNADKLVPHGVVVAVMDQIKEADIVDITIATE